MRSEDSTRSAGYWLLGAYGVRPVAVVLMRRRHEPSQRPGASACPADQQNCVDWKADRRQDGIWIRSGRWFQATLPDWRRSEAGWEQDRHPWLRACPTASCVLTCPPDRNTQLQSSVESRAVRNLIEWDICHRVRCLESSRRHRFHPRLGNIIEARRIRTGCLIFAFKHGSKYTAQRT